MKRILSRVAFDRLREATSDYDGACAVARGAIATPSEDPGFFARAKDTITATFDDLMRRKPQATSAFLADPGEKPDSRLDGYFPRERGALRNLRSAASSLLDGYRRQEPKSQKMIDMILRIYPRLEHQSPHFRSYPLEIRGLTPEEIKRFLESFAIWLVPLHVTKRKSGAVGSGFNLLMGDHRTEFGFLVPHLTADLGIHISRSCADRCRGITIENLSTNEARVKLTNIRGDEIRAVLRSESIAAARRVEIGFEFQRSTAVTRPEKPILTCDTVAESTLNVRLKSTCQLMVYVRRCPSVAVIEAKRALFLHGHSCTLAPVGCQDVAEIGTQASLGVHLDQITWFLMDVNIRQPNRSTGH
jgi:hypothetical protein